MRTVLEPSSSSSSVVGRDIYSSAKERAPACDDALSSFFPDKKRAMHIKTTTTTTTGDGRSMHHRFDAKASRYPNGRDEKTPGGEGKEAREKSRDAAFRLCLLAGRFGRPPRHARPRGSKIHPIFLAFRRPPRRAHPRGAMIIPSCWGYGLHVRTPPCCWDYVFSRWFLSRIKRGKVCSSLSLDDGFLCVFSSSS